MHPAIGDDAKLKYRPNASILKISSTGKRLPLLFDKGL
jgi:hypothetical protein